jgi:hypothetical protein
VDTKRYRDPARKEPSNASFRQRAAVRAP